MTLGTEAGSRVARDTPNLRLLALLEVVANRDLPFSLQSIVDETGLPKATVHRMLNQLARAGMLQRESAGPLYGTGQRLLHVAEAVLLNSTSRGARRMILRQLVNDIGESCNLTVFTGSEVLYLDRVETEAPLRFYLQSGSRVPVHCSATGKLFLNQMTPSQRRKILSAVPLEALTPNTMTDIDALQREIELVHERGYAFDDEEFLPGLICLGVLVPSAQGRSNMAIALQAPKVRLSRERALTLLPTLLKAAAAIARTR